MRAVDRALAEGAGPDAERLRSRLEREFDALHDALEFVDAVLPALPVCACGKACHRDRLSAERHLATLRVIAPRRGTPKMTLPSRCERRSIGVYRCLRSAGEVFHVGHLVVKK